MKVDKNILNEKILNSDVLVQDLGEKNKVIERKVVELTTELFETKKTFKILNSSTKKFDYIWNIQKPAHDKKGLGYKEITKNPKTKFVPATQGSTTTIKVENSKNTQVVKQVKLQRYVPPKSGNYVMQALNAKRLGSNARRSNAQ